MITVTVKFLTGKTLEPEFQDGADVFELKQYVVMDDNSPMHGIEVERVIIAYDGAEVKDSVRLVELGTYFPVLRLG